MSTLNLDAIPAMLERIDEVDREHGNPRCSTPYEEACAVIGVLVNCLVSGMHDAPMFIWPDEIADLLGEDGFGERPMDFAAVLIEIADYMRHDPLDDLPMIDRPDGLE